MVTGSNSASPSTWASLEAVLAGSASLLPREVQGVFVRPARSKREIAPGKLLRGCTEMSESGT